MFDFSTVLKFQSSSRPWHLPIIAGLCVSIPLLYGYFSGDMGESKLAAFGALGILYLQSNHLPTRITRLLLCGLLMLLSFAIGLLFSFNVWIGCAMLGIWSMLVHYFLPKLQLTRPPGNFFFIMVAAIGLTRPFDLDVMPTRMGFMAMGIAISCVIGTVYSYLLLRNKPETNDPPPPSKDHYQNLTESFIFGFFLGLSLLIAFLLQLENPYWVPVSTLAIMHGMSTQHVWTRFIQRILGTIIGTIGLAILLQLPWSPLGICLFMIALQIIVETLIVRNYAVASIFITMMTILLAESNVALLTSSNELFQNRLLDIVVGSIIGMIGGLFLYQEKLHHLSKKHIRRSKVVLANLKKK